MRRSRTRFPTEYAAWIDTPASRSLPGGETGNAAIRRALSALESIRDRHPEGRVLIVTHGTLIRLLVCASLGLNADDYRHRLPTIDTASLTTLTWGPAGAGLISYNLPAAHPGDALRTRGV